MYLLTLYLLQILYIFAHIFYCLVFVLYLLPQQPLHFHMLPLHSIFDRHHLHMMLQIRSLNLISLSFLQFQFLNFQSVELLLHSRKLLLRSFGFQFVFITILNQSSPLTFPNLNIFLIISWLLLYLLNHSDILLLDNLHLGTHMLVNPLQLIERFLLT